MIPLARTTLFPGDMMSLDSIQGVLEFAMRYDRNRFTLNFDKEEQSQLNSLYSTIQRLAREGNLDVRWNPDVQDGFQLDQASITTQGAKLLAELKSASKGGRISSKLSTIFWSVITSALTAYIVSSIIAK